MSHMPITPDLEPQPILFVAVVYTATGSEGTDFMVSIGRTMADTSYVVLETAATVAAVPSLEVPRAGQTTTQFEVVINGPLTAGDLLTFLVIQGAAA